MNSQLRISLDSFKNILDYPVSKKMICQGLIKVDGITEEMLYGSILSDEERDYILGNRVCEVEEDAGIHQIHVEEETAEVPIVKAITFYNWIKNDKEDKIRTKAYVLANKLSFLQTKKQEAKQEKNEKPKEEKDLFKEFGEEVELTEDMLPF